MNISAFIEATFKTLWAKFVFRGIVTGTSGNKVFIKRNPDDPADDQAYARLASYSAPAVDDEVIVLWMGGYIIIGKILR